MLKIGSHVGMSGKEMFLGSVKEALSYNANTFMVYTGAPQNTRRKDLNDLSANYIQQILINNADIKLTLDNFSSAWEKL